MSLGYIWVKGDDGNWYSDPFIGQPGDWEVDIEEFRPDTLAIRRTDNGDPYIAPMELVRQVNLPVAKLHDPRPMKVGKIRYLLYRVVWQDGQPLPARFFKDWSQRQEAVPTTEGTYLGLTKADRKQRRVGF